METICPSLASSSCSVFHLAVDVAAFVAVEDVATAEVDCGVVAAAVVPVTAVVGDEDVVTLSCCICYCVWCC